MVLGSDLYHLYYSSMKGDGAQEVVKGSLLLLPNKNTRVFRDYLVVWVLVLSLDVMEAVIQSEVIHTFQF